MTSPFRVELGAAGSAPAVRVGDGSGDGDELVAALGALGLRAPRPAVVVVGGAAGLRGAAMRRLRPVFAVGVVPAIEHCRAVGVDGGTRAGVMRLLGEARLAARASFPLVGVVPTGLVRLAAGPRRTDVETLPEPNHTHFVVAPGDTWGSESEWIARIATAIAGTAPSVSVLVDGGRIAYSDAEHSIRAGRPIFVVTGSGRTADALAAAHSGGATDARTAALVESGLIRPVPVDQPAMLAELLTAALR